MISWQGGMKGMADRDTLGPTQPSLRPIKASNFFPRRSVKPRRLRRRPSLGLGKGWNMIAWEAGFSCGPVTIKRCDPRSSERSRPNRCSLLSFIPRCLRWFRWNERLYRSGKRRIPDVNSRSMDRCTLCVFPNPLAISPHWTGLGNHPTFKIRRKTFPE